MHTSSFDNEVTTSKKESLRFCVKISRGSDFAHASYIKKAAAVGPLLYKADA